MKPVRVPIEFPAKYSNPLRFVVPMYIAWVSVLFVHAVLPLPDGVLLAVTGLWLLCLLGGLCVPLIYDLVLFPEGVQIRMFRKVIQQIPASRFRCLCAGGSERHYNLCLSCLDPDELTRRGEATLQKGWFTRHDLPFIRKQPDWRKRFARAYLKRPKWSLRDLHTETPVVWLPADPALVIYLRQLYPQLSHLDLMPDQSVNYVMSESDCVMYHTERYRIDEAGIHILRGKRELRLIPADSIQTVLRIDRFVRNNNLAPQMVRCLVASECGLRELANRGRAKWGQKWKRRIIEQLPEAEKLYAAEFYFAGVFTWNWKTADDCPMFYTAETEKRLRQFCPHAQWVDYSEKWR